MSPPNFGGSGGSCLPSSVIVALGVPGVPVICWPAAGAAERPGKVMSKVARPVANSNLCFSRYLFCSSSMAFFLSFDAPAAVRGLAKSHRRDVGPDGFKPEVRSHSVAGLMHQFDLAQPPLLREEGFQRAVQAKQREPALAGHGLYPVASLYD